MNIVLNKINHILMEKYLKLQDTCRTQVRRGSSPQNHPFDTNQAEDEQRMFECGGLGGQSAPVELLWKGNVVAFASRGSHSVGERSRGGGGLWQKLH